MTFSIIDIDTIISCSYTHCFWSNLMLSFNFSNKNNFTTKLNYFFGLDKSPIAFLKNILSVHNLK